VAILLGIISLAVGIIAIEKVDDDDIAMATISVSQSNAEVKVTNQEIGAYSPREDKTNSAEVPAPPGSRNYTGYKSPSGGRTGKTFDVIIHGHVSESYYSILQKGIDHAARTLG